MYILTGVIGMIIGGLISGWVDIPMLAGFLIGAMLYGVYYMIKNSNSTRSSSGDGAFGGCLLFAIIAGIFEGL